ncbi:hypothetical protein EYF80_040731 [Liparis tanakae]|uniref:Uncharacterized protein n=1 Tax=Liparis tanakae TaxID=230148 RepID=A0A4Z2G8E5_9TELE|nr:hypothetical protein EYF80_040731 [Liparis tanakae]
MDWDFKAGLSDCLSDRLSDRLSDACLTACLTPKLSVFAGPLLHLAEVRQLCNGLTRLQESDMDKTQVQRPTF